jgi:hypothetical protein
MSASPTVRAALALALALGWSLSARAQAPTPAPAPAPTPAPEAPQAPVAEPALTPAPEPAPAPAPVRTVPADAISEVDPIDIPPEDDPLAHAWDRPSDRGGFYLRGTATLGVHSTHLGPAPWDSNNGRLAHGFGSGFTLDLGAFLTPWLAVHADAMVGMLWNGNLDQEYALATDDGDGARIAAYGFAPAVTFYTPRAFYIKAAFGVGFANIQQPGPDNMTNAGFYTDLAVGKDLYVDRNFALGLQFQIAYMLLGDEDDIDEARVRQYLFGFSVAFDSI